MNSKRIKSLVYAYRAAKVLYNFLVSNGITGRVLLPVNVCKIVPDTCKLAGLSPVYVDIDKETLCMDEEKAIQLASDISTLLYVHTYGSENVPTSFFSRIKEKNPALILIDDRCLCMPSLVEPNTLADLTLYSLGAKKQVSLGRGGYGYMDCKWRYKEQASDNYFDDQFWTFDNSIIEEKTFGALSHKAQLNKVYELMLPAKICLPSCFQSWRFNIRVDDKKKIIDELFANGLFASSHYQPLKEGFENAQYLFDHVVNLFNDHFYSEEQAIRTCEIINQCL